MNKLNHHHAIAQRESRRLEAAGFTAHEEWMLTQRYMPGDIEHLLNERTVDQIKRELADEKGEAAPPAPSLFPTDL